MRSGFLRFHEQDSEVKKEFYMRDMTRKVLYLSNFDLYKSDADNWRDTLDYEIAPDPPDPSELPEVCCRYVAGLIVAVKAVLHFLFSDLVIKWDV